MSDRYETKNPAAGLVHTLKTAGGKVGEMIGVKQPAPKRANRVKLLFSVTNPSDEKKLKEILDDASVSLSFTFAGTGTARSQVLDYFGIGESSKSVVISLIPESDEDRIMHALRRDMALYLVGKGISFTVPLTGISEITANGLLKAAANKTTEGKIMTDQNRKYDLIVAAVEAGRVDEALEAARSAGAAGGTVLRARAVENEKAEQFIGITLAREQEVLLVLAKRESKLAIMNALSEKVGLKTEAGGVIFSLPVDRTAGISAADEEALRKDAEEKEEKAEKAGKEGKHE